MGLDIWFAEDIRNALLAADEASSSTARVCAAVGGDQVALRAYLEGYRAALSTLALAFGIAPQEILGGHSGQDATAEGESIREIGSKSALECSWEVSSTERFPGGG